MGRLLSQSMYLFDGEVAIGWIGEQVGRAVLQCCETSECLEPVVGVVATCYLWSSTTTDVLGGCLIWLLTEDTVQDAQAIWTDCILIEVDEVLTTAIYIIECTIADSDRGSWSLLAVDEVLTCRTDCIEGTLIYLDVVELTRLVGIGMDECIAATTLGEDTVGEHQVADSHRATLLHTEYSGLEVVYLTILYAQFANGTSVLLVDEVSSTIIYEVHVLELDE